MAEWSSLLNYNGHPIPPWTDTAQEYEIVYRFPDFTKRFDIGPHCLTLKERFDLQGLVDGCKQPPSPSFDDKVSLIAGGNLAHVATDAIINASNCWLTTGKGVNGAVHSGAGECLLDECVRLGGCEVGDAKLTSGYNLPAKHVIHTVGPDGADTDRADKLRSCYWNCLEVCLSMSIRTVAFPCISTGQYGYPSVEAGHVALTTIRDWLTVNHSQIDRIVFVTKMTRDEETYSSLMLKYFPISK
jgi:O-acetyl-ADP-ribose deacetylase (regulator of RNase III)